MDKDKIKMIRLTGKSLDLATELIEDFRQQGLRASWTSVVDAAIPLMYATMIDKNFTLVSNAELAETRAYDVGTSIAVILGVLYSAKVDMTGCQLRYLPEVDAISIHLDAIGDNFIHAGGAAPASIANVVKDQLVSRGYLGDGGTVVVDMDLLLGAPVREGK